MNLLAIDCTEFPLSIAATNAQHTVVKCGAQWQKSGEQIVALIAETLQDLQIKPSNLNAVALSSGPGSFTALRIGIATAKGLCFAHDLPLVMIPTFEALAHATFTRSEAKTLFTVSYSKADEFYVGIASRETPIEYDYLTIDQLNHKLKRFERVAVVGRNLSRWASLFEASEVIEANFFTAELLLPIAEEKLKRGEVADLTTASPLYLKNFEAKKKSKSD
jgi:tRNA threonylcarbamoyladenosine biosynthesis protein TsaB